MIFGSHLILYNQISLYEYTGSCRAITLTGDLPDKAIHNIFI